MARKEYKQGDIVTLDDIEISVATYLAWNEVARTTMLTLAAAGVRLHPSQIPDEQATLLENGSLEIFAVLPGDIRVSMPIPAGEWKFR